jgi:hypothetical protein
MPNRRITDLIETAFLTSSFYLPVYDPNETQDSNADGYIDYNKKIRLKNFINVPTQSSITWFGSGADGDLSTTSSISFTNTVDGEVVVKNYKSLIINSGHTVTTQFRCKGLLIYVGGDCTIDGTLTMTARGAAGSGSYAHYLYQGKNTYGNFIPMYYFNSSSIINSSSYAASGFIPIYPVGASGGAANTNGVSGIYGQTGGGGGGRSGGSGTSGTSWSGGSGGGAGAGGSSGGLYAGVGGSTSTLNCGGGAGNGGGSSGGGTGTAGSSGTGGLIILIVKGTLTIGSSGIINSDGSSGGDGSAGGGGGSGGGRVIILYNKQFSNSGTITANGGSGGGIAPSFNGGSGGAGNIIIRELNVW